MKKIRNILIVLIGVCVLTGCGVKYETTMGISSDGKVDFSIVTAYDKEFIATMKSMMDSMGGGATTPDGSLTGPENEQTPTTPTNPTAPTAPTPANMTDEEAAQFLFTQLEEETQAKEAATKKGFTLSRYQENGYFGYKYSASIPNIETVSDANGTLFDISKVVDEESTLPITDYKMFKKTDNVYTATFVFDPSNQNPDAEDAAAAGGDTEQLTQALNAMTMDYKFVVTLPNKPTTNNATSVSEDGKTLTWTLSKDQKTEINFAFEMVAATKKESSGGFSLDDNMKMYIGIGAIVLIVIILLVIIMSKNKKKKAMQEVAPVENPTTPVDAAVNAIPANPVMGTEPVTPDPGMPEAMAPTTPDLGSVANTDINTIAIGEQISNDVPASEPVTPAEPAEPVTPAVEQTGVMPTPEVSPAPTTPEAPAETPVETPVDTTNQNTPNVQ